MGSVDNRWPMWASVIATSSGRRHRRLGRGRRALELARHVVPGERVAAMALLGRVPTEEEAEDDPPQDRGSADLHDAAGELLVLHRRQGGDAGRFGVEAVQRLLGEGEER